MLTVHHLGISQSERIVWLCEELGLDYELKRYERRADNRLAPDEYKALHPMGIAPVITDGDLVLGESGAICDYICARYGGGRLTPGAGRSRLRRPPVLVPLVQRHVHDHADDAAGAGRRRRGQSGARCSSTTAAGAAGRWSRRGWARRRSSAART